MAGIPQRRGDAEELGSERRAQTHLTGDAVNEITGDILDASVKIHRMFGPGMLESVYERLLALELERRGHQVERQKDVSFCYENVKFENAFRLDLLVDGEVIVELKSSGAMSPVYAKQVRTYLVLTGRQVGLLVNFGMATMKDGFVRVVNSKTPDLSEHNLCVSATLRDVNITKGTD